MHWFFLSALVSVTMYGGPWNDMGLNGTGPLKGHWLNQQMQNVDYGGPVGMES